MIENGMRPVHPGEVLREDFLLPLGLSANALAQALHVSVSGVVSVPTRPCAWRAISGVMRVRG